MKVSAVLALTSVGAVACASQHIADAGAKDDFIPPTHLMRSTSPTVLPNVVPDCTPEDPVCFYFVKSHALHAEAGTDVDSTAPKAEVLLDADLEGVQNLSSPSHITRQQAVPYPYELVIEDYNKTAIHQAIATHQLSEYDASVCAMRCNEHRACDAFAIYVESEPSCTKCWSPRIVETNKCDLYNTPLQLHDIRKESSQEEVHGKTITRAVHAYNGYNRVRKTATVTATRTQTVTVSESPKVSFITSNIHHTVWSECSKPATRTVTVAQPAITVTETSTKSAATVKPTTKTQTILFTSAEPSTLTKTKTVMFTSAESSTLTETQSRTVLFSVTDTTTASETKTRTAMFTETKPMTLTKTKSRTAMFTKTTPTTLTRTQSRTLVVSATPRA